MARGTGEAESIAAGPTSTMDTAAIAVVVAALPGIGMIGHIFELSTGVASGGSG